MLRITPLTVHSKMGAIVPDCATGGDSTSGGVLTGAIVDRLALGYSYTHAQPVLLCEKPGTTSTGGARWVSLQVKLRHGDSSGGGDLADLTTGLIADAIVYYTTQGESTDWKNWTTGLQRMQCSPKAFPLMGAKRFLAPAAIITRIGGVTATAAANLVSADLGLTLLNQGEETSSEFSVQVSGSGQNQQLKTTSTAT